MFVKVKVGTGGRYVINIDGQNILMTLNSEYENIELYEFMGLVGLSIRAEDGVYNTDITKSGMYKMIRVEDENGQLLHDQMFI
jgi:hypothetical protein